MPCDWITAGEAMRLLGLRTYDELHALIRNGKLESYRLHSHGHHRICRESVERLLRERNSSSNEPDA
ncbi:helix-turn-helix domain-containing protein [Alicyclobacillus mali]|uniref:Helix-turn-helix domain-containing protein n=1 Tax=Alicyclobacillus mali (ex Roth et al. 2021) TaxID=1123961 RepID=A0ABS0EZA5_9BACL|nr:helix-turn-helix domain-containing protein [Alicyclobacillus mali (ex Roth et al. 2021)]